MKYQWNRDEAREVLSLWGTFLIFPNSGIRITRPN